jgi:hypothetical protein
MSSLELSNQTNIEVDEKILVELNVVKIHSDAFNLSNAEGKAV